MINRLTVYETTSTDPWKNLALEEWLMRYVSPGECLLYLWQNEKTVVIGRNQNIFNECRLSELTAAGGKPARRLSGGGAVYHDMGNQNFTFIVRKPDYDTAMQTEVIIRAAELLGVQAERTGRNDITAAGGRKFSGHAYYKSGGACYHHGTLMINVSMDELERYLKPPQAKLRAKGVQSVRSRVVNLSEICPGLTAEAARGALKRAFSGVYGLPFVKLTESDINGSGAAELEKKYSSPEWLYNRVIDAEMYASGRFDWGGVTVAFTIDNGVISDMVLSSDGLDAEFIAAVPSMLTGCEPEECALSKRLKGQGTGAMADDIVKLVTGAVNVED